MKKPNKQSSSLPKLTKKEALVISLLLLKEWRSGYELKRVTGPLFRRGDIYPLLARMVKKGFLETKEVPVPDLLLSRCLYRSTPQGEAAYLFKKESK